MLVICNKHNTKFCTGSSCEHYNPHELQINEVIDYSKMDCSEQVCLGLDDKYHPVKCVEWIKSKDDAIEYECEWLLKESCELNETTNI